MLEGLSRFNIYVDLDGTVADFDYLFSLETGFVFRVYEEKYGDAAAWNLLRSIPDFWLRLPLMPGAMRLMQYLKPYAPIMLTSPSTHDTHRAMFQKRQWVNDKLGNHVPVIFRRAKHKSSLATPNSILIDDYEYNIEQWRSRGGVGILFDSVEQVLEELEEIKDQSIEAPFCGIEPVLAIPVKSTT